MGDLLGCQRRTVQDASLVDGRDATATSLSR